MLSGYSTSTLHPTPSPFLTYPQTRSQHITSHLFLPTSRWSKNRITNIGEQRGGGGGCSPRSRLWKNTKFQAIVTYIQTGYSDIEEQGYLIYKSHDVSFNLEVTSLPVCFFSSRKLYSLKPEVYILEACQPPCENDVPLCQRTAFFSADVLTFH